MAKFKKAFHKFAANEQAKQAKRQDALVWGKGFIKACKWFFKQGKKQVQLVPFQEEITYRATGLVLGITWEGVEGTYPMTSHNFENIQDVLITCETKLKLNSLTGTADFQKQLGAILAITKSTTIQVNGKPFINTEVSIEYVGDLTVEQMGLLDNEFNF